MKKFKTGKLLTTVCALLAFVLVFTFTACNTDAPEGGNGLSLNSYALTIDEGSSSPLLVTSNPSADVIWTSSDESKVTVEGSGNGNRMCMVTAVATGTATVTATAGESYATCTVTVIDAEVITIKKDGTEVSSDIAINEKGGTVQLSASSSRDHDIVWETSKPLIATVSSNGLVTAVASSGTVEIIAKCAQHSDVYTSVKVVVGNGVDSAYALKQGDENANFGNYNSNDNPGEWIYWNQYGNVVNAIYNEGVISFQTTGVEEGAIWYNVQLFYTATSADKDADGKALKAGQLYELTFDLETGMAGHITVNGYVIELQAGVNHCTAYYEHGATAFAMQLGVENVGCDITNTNIKLSNIAWKVSEPIKLVAPSFTVGANNVITITDTNLAGVSSYTLNLYDENNVRVGGVLVENGKAVNTDRIIENGDYTAQIVANAASANFVSSQESEVTENNIVTVNHTESKYDIVAGGAPGALLEAGTWTYWTESWVIFSGSVTNGKATISFSNNTGNWYDTQVFFKIPGKNTEDKYTLKLHIDNTTAGRITVNGKVHTLVQGNNEISLDITESDGATITIVFGVDGENKRQEIQVATNMQIYFELVENNVSGSENGSEE